VSDRPLAIDPSTGQSSFHSPEYCISFLRIFLSTVNLAFHNLASDEPIPNLTAEQLSTRMPAAAAIDLLEWAPSQDLASYVNEVLLREIQIERALNPDVRIRITDDRPYNEYFLLRRYFHFPFQ